MLPYPTSLPADDVLNLVNTIRSGRLVQEKATVTKTVWVVAGFAAGQLIGEPPNVLDPSPAPSPSPANPVHMAQSCPPCSEEQVLEYLELFCGHQKQGVYGAVAVPWAAVLKWALTLLLGVL